MSGDVHRRHPATRVLAAALACALAWLGLTFLLSVEPPSQPGHVVVDVAVTQPAVPHVAQRAVVRMMHVRAAMVSASQRQLSGPAPMRAMAIVLLVLLGLRPNRRRAPRRHAVRMHGVRAPPTASAGLTAAGI